MPPVVQMCYKSWKKHNPEWQLVLLTNQNVADYVDGQRQLGSRWPTLPLAAKSDLIRIYLLANYGGVWVDATTFCTKSLDSWLHAQMKTGFFAFSRPNTDRLLSSWFMAAEKGNTLAAAYQQLAFNFWQSVNPKTLLKREEKYHGLSAMAKWLYQKKPTWAVQSWFVRVAKISHYFWFHYAFEVLNKQSASCAKMWDETPTFSANQPHILLHFGYTNPMNDALKRELENPSAPLYKLNWRFNPADYPGTAMHALSAMTEEG